MWFDPPPPAVDLNVQQRVALFRSRKMWVLFFFDDDVLCGGDVIVTGVVVMVVVSIVRRAVVAGAGGAVGVTGGVTGGVASFSCDVSLRLVSADDSAFDDDVLS